MPKIKKTPEFIALESFITKFQCMIRVKLFELKRKLIEFNL